MRRREVRLERERERERHRRQKKGKTDTVRNSERGASGRR